MTYTFHATHRDLYERIRRLEHPTFDQPTGDKQ